MELALMGLLIVQQIFWMLHTQKLTNKIMSRNLFEYNQAEQAFKPSPPKIMVAPDPEDDMDHMAGMGGF